jgi:hypothetical protein
MMDCGDMFFGYIHSAGTPSSLTGVRVTPRGRNSFLNPILMFLRSLGMDVVEVVIGEITLTNVLNR